MADINVLFKNAVKEIAAAHGVSATFMAKPHFDDAGSSFHIHSSLWSPDGSTSAMPGDGEHHLSEAFRWYLGGLLATAAEFALLVAPTVNSYKRFLPGSWAPTGIGWGVDNRTLGFRVVGHGEGLRVENRIPGADANTYHAFAATIAGGLYGLANKIDPPPAVRGQRLHGDRPAAHPRDVRRGDRAVAQQRRSPGSASATTSTTTCCTSPRRSGRRSTRPSPTGSGAGTSSGSRPARSRNRCACPRCRRPGGGGSPSSG